MADNFNFKKYLLENKLGSYSKAVLKEGMEDYDIKGMQADLDAMSKGDVDDAPMDEPTPQYRTYADVVNAIAKKYSYTVYHDEIEEFMHDKKSLSDIVAGKDPIKAYEEFYNIQRESKENPIDPEDPYATGPMQGGMFEGGASSALDSLNNLERALLNLKKNVATDSTIGTESKTGLLRAFEEMMKDLQTIAYEVEGDDEPEYTSDYSKRRASEY